jgi:3-isopropylmalate dehydrogenase
MQAAIVFLPGDGIGPEIVQEARRVLERIATKHNHDIEVSEAPIGGAAIDASGVPLPEETLTACRRADAILLGAVGGPKWDDPQRKVRPEQGLLALRKGLGLFANLRPVTVHPALASASPLRPERIEGVDFLVVRELTGGLYFGEPRLRETKDGIERAVDTLEYSAPEVERVVRLAFTIAQGRRQKLTSVDKANVLETSRLWRSVAEKVSEDFPDVRLEHQLVDSCAMRLLTHAQEFDVIVTENMFGDILTDEAAALSGSLGLLPSASLGSTEGSAAGPKPRGVYEPIHGSAPDIAGKGLANPLGTILSLAMLLRHSLGLSAEAEAIERAVHRAVQEGARTRDLGGDLSTSAMGDAVIERL